MNEGSASQALRALATGDERKLDELCTWLLQRDGDIAARYLASDLRVAVKNAATESDDGGLQSLLLDLANRPDSVLIAVFPTAKASGTVFELPGALIGPAASLAAAAPSPDALNTWVETDDALAILTRHPAQGRLGAIRAASWLQTVLGAIGLAAYARSRTLAPVALCPAIGSAMFLSTSSAEPDPVDRAVLLAPTPEPELDLAQILAPGEWRDLMLDATARTPADLTQQRLTLAVRWLQLAASAAGTADALIALGVALEVITGDENKGAVVERVTKRSAVFLTSAAPPDERSDLYYEELKRAKKLYDLRSRVAHGQYDESTRHQDTEDSLRTEFHRFVLDVTLGFRGHARQRNMRDANDFNTWWKRAEIEGVFA